MSAFTKEQLFEKLTWECESLRETILNMDERTFFSRVEPDKWSAAENVHHLQLAVRLLLLAFALPHWVLRVFGKPYGDGRSYEEVVASYQQKLKAGAKASLPYVPSKKHAESKQMMTEKMLVSYGKLKAKLEPWPEEALDHYLLPHPILGRITLREMFYFTCYHVQHHHMIIRNRYSL